MSLAVDVGLKFREPAVDWVCLIWCWLDGVGDTRGWTDSIGFLHDAIPVWACLASLKTHEFQTFLIDFT